MNREQGADTIGAAIERAIVATLVHDPLHTLLAYEGRIPHEPIYVPRPKYMRKRHEIRVVNRWLTYHKECA